MYKCLLKFSLPIFLFYIGFILLGTSLGLAIGLLISAILISSVIGFFIGVALAIISNAIILVVAAKLCLKNTCIYC